MFHFGFLQYSLQASVGNLWSEYRDKELWDKIMEVERKDKIMGVENDKIMGVERKQRTLWFYDSKMNDLSPTVVIQPLYHLLQYICWQIQQWMKKLDLAVHFLSRKLICEEQHRTTEEQFCKWSEEFCKWSARTIEKGNILNMNYNRETYVVRRSERVSLTYHSHVINPKLCAINPVVVCVLHLVLKEVEPRCH